MFNNFSEDNISIGIVGLGYVGLPLAVLLSKKYNVIGFDLNESKIELYKNGVDITSELEDNVLEDTTILFTSSADDLKDANFIIVAVPTPINENKSPNLSYIESATKIVANNLKKGSIVVYESTVFPGVTEDICIPLIEEITGFTCGNEFSVGYSPERVSPGDKNKSIADITKIVSGFDENTLDIVSNVYSSVLNNGIYQAPSIKVAEAAKITENIQRDVNIALMNELSIIFNNIGIDTNEVIEAAGTKWNFAKYRPGLVGGHCIGVDPYYLIYKSKKLHYSPRLLQTSRLVNEDIISHVVDNVLSILNNQEVDVTNSNILVLGITFKENCNDIRNSKIAAMIKQLHENGVKTTVYDSLADPEKVREKYCIDLAGDYSGKYDAIILAVAHNEFKQLTYEQICNLSKNTPVLFDLKSLLKKMSKEDIIYWSL